MHAQGAEALEYLHSQQLIHRDIKSSNFLLDGDWHCKLSDFGMAREVGHFSQQLLFTSSYFHVPEKTVLGTDTKQPSLPDIRKRFKLFHGKVCELQAGAKACEMDDGLTHPRIAGNAERRTPHPLLAAILQPDHFVATTVLNLYTSSSGTWQRFNGATARRFDRCPAMAR